MLEIGVPPQGMHLIDKWKAGRATAKPRDDEQRDFELEVVWLNAGISREALHGSSTLVADHLSERALCYLRAEKYEVERVADTSSYRINWKDTTEVYQEQEANRAAWLKDRKAPCGECGMTGGPGALPGSYSGCPVCGYCG